MRARNPICPRCKVREKAPGRAYCADCYKEKCKEWNAQRVKSLREKTCPLCGKKFVAPGKQYCEVCRKLCYSTRAKLMKRKAEEEKARREGKNAFAGLQAEAQQINWRYVRGCGIVSKKPEAPPPEKRELALSDFVGRDNEPSIFQHL